VANIWWYFNEPIKPFESFCIDVTIDRDVPSTYNLYIAPIGLGQLGRVKFYGGLQTNANGWPSKELRERHFIGKGGIFSRWSNRPISLDYARGAADTHFESAGYEGDFVSVRRAYPWTKGTYTVCLAKEEEVVIDGKDHTWIGMTVASQPDGEKKYIGSLCFEGKDLTFWDRHSAFVEVYATSRIRRSEIPQVKISFGYPRINGEFPDLKSAHAFYPNRGSAASPDCAVVTAEGSRAVVEVGKIFQRDERLRHHDLPLAEPSSVTTSAGDGEAAPSP
jgi:hypothetical protein